MNDPPRNEQLREFARWCAQYLGFPSGRIGYWIDAYERGDGTDMYGQKLRKS